MFTINSVSDEPGPEAPSFGPYGTELRTTNINDQAPSKPQIDALSGPTESSVIPHSPHGATEFDECGTLFLLDEFEHHSTGQTKTHRTISQHCLG